jgi:hypothetical protein
MNFVGLASEKRAAYKAHGILYENITTRSLRCHFIQLYQFWSVFPVIIVWLINQRKVFCRFSSETVEELLL